MKTDLEKSHSKLSNFKLTIICLILAIGVCLSFIGLDYTILNKQMGVVILIVGVCLTILSLISLKFFKR